MASWQNMPVISSGDAQPGSAASGRGEGLEHSRGAGRRKWWGWGVEGGGPSEDQARSALESLGMLFGRKLVPRVPPSADHLDLPAPKVVIPEKLGVIAAQDSFTRASHAFGKSYRDVIRSLHGRVDHPPDAVCYPAGEKDVATILEWCSDTSVAVIPYGGGSSVVGGVEPVVGDRYLGVVTMDMGLMGRVLDVDQTSRAASIEAGALGPAIEDQLRPYGLTIRHFPQSFEFSSLGGWIATRAGGHFATLYTHIDDLVESIRLVAPAGVMESRRLPGSGAGPSPDRLALGSEGALGVITRAWVRLQARPRWRSGAAVRFRSFEEGVAAAKAVAQSGLFPANCRLLDPGEALASGADSTGMSVLVLAFESADHPLSPWIERAVECCKDHGGILGDEGIQSTTGESRADGGAALQWRKSFLNGPYLRDILACSGVLCETFETAVTWDRFGALNDAVQRAVRGAFEETGATPGILNCRFTHVYPDGPAPYYTVLAPAREGSELAQWSVIKEAASEAVLASGGTITHHHAVGRDHRKWYEEQRPAAFGSVLSAAKAMMDPAWVCNPGVLVGGSASEEEVEE